MFDVVVLDMLSLYPHEDEEEEKKHTNHSFSSFSRRSCGKFDVDTEGWLEPTHAFT